MSTFDELVTRLNDHTFLIESFLRKITGTDNTIHLDQLNLEQRRHLERLINEWLVISIQTDKEAGFTENKLHRN